MGDKDNDDSVVVNDDDDNNNDAGSDDNDDDYDRDSFFKEWQTDTDSLWVGTETNDDHNNVNDSNCNQVHQWKFTKT